MRGRGKHTFRASLIFPALRAVFVVQLLLTFFLSLLPFFSSLSPPRSFFSFGTSAYILWFELKQKPLAGYFVFFNIVVSFLEITQNKCGL